MKFVVEKERLAKEFLKSLSFPGVNVFISDLSFETKPYVVLCKLMSMNDIDSRPNDLSPFMYAVLNGLTMSRSALPRHSA